MSVELDHKAFAGSGQALESAYLVCCILHDCCKRGLLRNAKSAAGDQRQKRPKACKYPYTRIMSGFSHSIGKLWVRCQRDFERNLGPAKQARRCRR